MTGTVLIADVGDVLIGTHPDAHYRALATLTGIPSAGVKSTIEQAELPRQFERGTIGPHAFASCVRTQLSAPGLSDADVWNAWTAVVGEPILAIVAAAVSLADTGRLVLASNTNFCHWRVVRSRLIAAGLSVPISQVVLSFEIGSVKPDAGFFRALLHHISGVAIFVDDRACNVAAAHEHGLDGWIHSDIGATAARIATLAADGQR